jgi:hypothetical protein
MANIEFNKAKISRDMERGIKQGVEALHAELNKMIVKRLSKPGTGKQYPKAKKTTKWQEEGFPRYRSAAKGRPPAVQTGRLRRSWVLPSAPKRFIGGYRSILHQVEPTDSGVTSPVKYGLYLETDKSGALGKGLHPFLGGQFGAIAIVQRQSQKIFRYYFEKAIRDAGGKT